MMEKVKLVLKMTQEQQDGIKKALNLGENEKVELLEVDLTEEDLGNVKSNEKGILTVGSSSERGVPKKVANKQLWFEALGKTEIPVQRALSCCCLWIQESAEDKPPV